MNLETDPKLLELLEESVDYKMSPAEHFWQKVSFVMSGMPEGTDISEVAMKVANAAGFNEPPPEPNSEGLIMRPKLCKQCQLYPDDGNGLCCGCDAYRDHTGYF